MMGNNLAQNLDAILTKTVETVENNKKTNALFTVFDEDLKFVKAELLAENTEEYKLDSYVKLFLAFYVESIPEQIITMIKKAPQLYKGHEELNDYLMNVAGLLHEAKSVLVNNEDEVISYLIAYREFVGKPSPDDVPDERLPMYYMGIIEKAIQALINL